MMQPFQNEFLKTVIPAAQASNRATGVPASITIAQAILESGWGQTRLAEEFNNYFGIKANQEQLADHDYCEFPTHEVVNGVTTLVQGKFAQYASPEESFATHARLLCRPHYVTAMARRGNPDAFAWALGPKSDEHPEGCGYSTLPQYHDRLMGLVRDYDLTQYDIQQAAGASA